MLWLQLESPQLNEAEMKYGFVFMVTLVVSGAVVGCSNGSSATSVVSTPAPTGVVAIPASQVALTRASVPDDNIEVITKEVTDRKIPGVRPNLLVGDNGNPWIPPRADWDAAIKERENSDKEGSVAVYGWRKLSDFHRQRIKGQYLRVLDAKLQ